jgi:hypothetical protein
LAVLEAKLAEQAKQIENFVTEKSRVEQELAAAKANGGTTAPGIAVDDSKLKEKIAQLEAKLAEYSVIEDDLANLKRLQQENTSLKAQLGGKAAPGAAAATPEKEAKEKETRVTGEKVANTVLEPKVSAEKAPAAAAEAKVAAKTGTDAEKETGVKAAAAEAEKGTLAKAEATAEAQSKTQNETAEAQAKAAKSAATNEKEAKASGAVAGNPAPGAPDLGKSIAEAQAGALDTSGFEGLVDQVEQSIQPAAAATEAMAPATSTDAKPSTEAAPAATIEKTDADLVAEFEKMLNG